MKVIGIVKNNCITGIEYGLIEIQEVKEKPRKLKSEQKTTKKDKKRKNKQKQKNKQNRQLKAEQTEKETKAAKKTKKVRYHIRATFTYPYHFKTTKKLVDLKKKRHQKTKTLFKQKQRDEKLALQNMMQRFDIVVPLFDYIQILKQNQK